MAEVFSTEEIQDATEQSILEQKLIAIMLQLVIVGDIFVIPLGTTPNIITHTHRLFWRICFNENGPNNLSTIGVTNKTINLQHNERLQL